MIDLFIGENFYLSNFYEAPVEYNGIVYPHTESAFQAQKCLSKLVQEEFKYLKPGQAKRYGKKVPLREDWEQVKDNIMYEVCLAKFKQHKDLAEKLIATGDEELAEGNNWGDTYWGTVDGVGKNMLGKVLMRVRSEIQKNDRA